MIPPPHHHLHLSSHHRPQLPSARPRKLDHWKVNNEPFELDSRYTVLEYLGSGAYGVVCSVIDTSAINNSQHLFHSSTTTPPSSSSSTIGGCLPSLSSSTSSMTSSFSLPFPSPPPPTSSHHYPPLPSSDAVTSSSSSSILLSSSVRRDYVAIKKCKNIFESRTMAKRTLREMRILRCLNHSHVCLSFSLSLCLSFTHTLSLLEDHHIIVN
jgi:hypothetical protein